MILGSGRDGPFPALIPTSPPYLVLLRSSDRSSNTHCDVVAMCW